VIERSGVRLDTTEAAEHALRSAHDDFGWTTAVSVISVDNPASIALAERLGATREATIEYRYGPAYLYRHRPWGEPDLRTAQ
jgi:RimJ/RimL family protein N-acetyltransferase